MESELQRIAELLRPLWPGVVLTNIGSRLMGSTGRVHIDVYEDKGGGWFTEDCPGKIYPWTCTVGVAGVQCSATWWAPEEAAAALQNQWASCGNQIVAMREAADDLTAALGLEVSDG